MGEAKIASKTPTVVELDPGTYHWCSCGLSKQQPFCDGSHKDSGFTPLAFYLEEKKRVALCNCKRTACDPFCDGKHSEL